MVFWVSLISITFSLFVSTGSRWSSSCAGCKSTKNWICSEAPEPTVPKLLFLRECTAEHRALSSRGFGVVQIHGNVRWNYLWGLITTRFPFLYRSLYLFWWVSSKNVSFWKECLTWEWTYRCLLLYVILLMNLYLRNACSHKHVCGDRVCNFKSKTKAHFSSDDFFLSVTSSPSTNNVVSKPDSSPNLKETNELTVGRDVDTDFYAWKGSLEAASKQDSKLRKDVKTMDDILRHLVVHLINKIQRNVYQDIH